MKVSLYTTPECGLCRQAEAILRRLQEKIRFELALVDIGGDDELFRKYWDKIPVVLRDGQEIAAAPLDERTLRDALRR